MSSIQSVYNRCGSFPGALILKTHCPLLDFRLREHTMKDGRGSLFLVLNPGDTFYLLLEFLLCPVITEPSPVLLVPIATFCQYWLISLSVLSSFPMFWEAIDHAIVIVLTACSSPIAPVRNKHRCLPLQHEL